MGVDASPASAVAGAGGRVTLEWPIRMVDTRVGQPTTGPVRLQSLAQVVLTDASQPGTAWLHPCGSPAAGETVAEFEADETVAFKVASSDDTCLSASTPVHVIVDRRGSITPTATPSGLQYVPLAAGRVVFEQMIDMTVPGSSTPLTLDIGTVPPVAGGAVLLVEALAPTSPGYVAVWNSPDTQVADMNFANDRAAGLAYTPLQPGSEELYMRVYGETPLRVTLLGFLSSDGPDASRLPPTLTYADDDLRAPGLRAITPQRVLDTRDGLGAPSAAKIQAGVPFELALSAHVAGSSTAAVLNITVTEPDAPGYLTVYPCDRPRPTAANLNYVRGETVPNLVVAKLSVTRSVCIFSQSSTHLVADLSGTFERNGGTGVHAVAPFRLLDTREPIGVPAAGKLLGGEVLTLQIADRGGVPASGAGAVTMNVTVTEPDLPGYITAYPCDQDRPTAANLNYTAGQTVPNLVTVRLSAQGTVCLFALNTTHLIADLAAWYGFDQPDGYQELTPERLLDTREPIGVPAVGKLAGGDVLTVQIAGRGGVPPTGAAAITMNVTVTEPEQGGYLTVYPCDEERPLAANLNYDKGETVPNLVTVKLSAAGTACIFTQYSTHLVADVSGYFTAQRETILAPHISY